MLGEQHTATGGLLTGDGRLLREANPFRYASYQYDEESKFYYLKSRYYIPFMGRFLTRDEISEYNLYTYCKNNPVVYFDPNGRSAVAIGAGVGSFGGPIGTLIGAAIGVVITLSFLTVMYFAAEHTKNKRPSTKGKHEEAESRRQRDKGGEKGDKRRKPNPNSPKNKEYKRKPQRKKPR